MGCPLQNFESQHSDLRDREKARANRCVDLVDYRIRGRRRFGLHKEWVANSNVPSGDTAGEGEDVEVRKLGDLLVRMREGGAAAGTTGGGADTVLSEFLGPGRGFLDVYEKAQEWRKEVVSMGKLDPLLQPGTEVIDATTAAADANHSRGGNVNNAAGGESSSASKTTPKFSSAKLKLNPFATTTSSSASPAPEGGADAPPSGAGDAGKTEINGNGPPNKSPSKTGGRIAKVLSFRPRRRKRRPKKRDEIYLPPWGVYFVGLTPSGGLPVVYYPKAFFPGLSELFDLKGQFDDVTTTRGTACKGTG